MNSLIKNLLFIGFFIGLIILISCSGDEYPSEFNVRPYFGTTSRYACDTNNPPKAGEAPCDIDVFRLCAYSEKLNSIICNEYSIEDGKNGAQFKLPEANDYRIFFQGYNKAKSDVMLWCGATEKIPIAKGEKKDISMFIGRCSDFVFSRNKMNVNRVFHTATLLKDGRVLIVGGITSVSSKSCDPDCDGDGCKPYCRLADAIADAEIYDYKKGEFQKIGKLNIPRVFHTATLMPDGKVLIAGGSKSVKLFLVPLRDKPFVLPESMDEASSTIEIFDPQTNTFKKVQSSVSRVMHSAYLSPNGKVYAFGGISDNSGNYETKIAEISTSSGMNDSKVSLTTGRILPTIIDFSVVDQSSQNIAVMGGTVIDEEHNKGNSFDIISFSEATPAVKEHGYSSKDSYILSSFGMGALPINSGKFIICGGMMMRDIKLGFNGSEKDIYAANPLDFIYYFDINNSNISYPDPGRSSNLIYKRALFQSVYLYSKNPRILFTGGFESVNPDLFTDSSVIPFVPSRSVELFLVDSDIFDSIHPAGIVDAVNPVVKMNENRAGHTITVLPDQTILLTGGFSSSSEISNTAEVFQPYPVDKNVSLFVY